MFVITRRRLVGVSSALTLGVAVALMLTTIASAGGPILHRASAGGPDACLAFGETHPGCDGNFSLTATEYADGTVSGQYTDRFARGDGFHAVIDCLAVEDNRAWVSGVITSGRITDPDTGERIDLTGLFVFTVVQDNGISANDPPDEISFSFIDSVPTLCTTEPDVGDLLEAPQGQVKVD